MAQKSQWPADPHYRPGDCVSLCGSVVGVPTGLLARTLSFLSILDGLTCCVILNEKIEKKTLRPALTPLSSPSVDTAPGAHAQKTVLWIIWGHERTLILNSTAGFVKNGFAGFWRVVLRSSQALLSLIYQSSLERSVTSCCQTSLCCCLSEIRNMDQLDLWSLQWSRRVRSRRSAVWLWATIMIILVLICLANLSKEGPQQHAPYRRKIISHGKWLKTLETWRRCGWLWLTGY